MAFNSTERLFSNTSPINQNRARTAIQSLYQHCGLVMPRVVFVDGPTHFESVVKEDLCSVNLFKYEKISHFVTKRGSSKHDRMKHYLRNIYLPLLNSVDTNTHMDWFKLFIAEDFRYTPPECREDNSMHDEWLPLANDVWNSTYMVLNYENIVYVFDRPSEVHTDDRGFHNTEGPCLVFRDGTEYYGHRGQFIKKEHFLHPEKMTIEEINSYGKKHVVIDMVGIDRFKKLCEEWQPPETENRFSRFFYFSQIANANIHQDGYEVKIYHGELNGEGVIFATQMDQGEIRPSLFFIKDEDQSGLECLIEPEDMELWDSLRLSSMFRHGDMCKLILGYKEGRFYARGSGSSGYRDLKKNVAPVWFKTHMLRGENAEYVCEDYTIKYSEEEGLHGPVHNETLKMDAPFWGNEQSLPTMRFNFELESDTWAGLLHKLSRYAFEWMVLFN